MIFSLMYYTGKKENAVARETVECACVCVCGGVYIRDKDVSNDTLIFTSEDDIL